MFHTQLAIDQRLVVANAKADTVRMIIYSDAGWTMETAGNTAPWAAILKGSGTGKDYAIITVTDNNANLPRSGATFVVRAGAKTDTIQLRQKGLVPTLAITAASVSSPAAGGAVQTAINTNIPRDSMLVSYVYDANGTDWISGLEIADNNLQFNVAANETTVDRMAKLYLSYLDALGKTTKDSLIVNQLKP